MTFHVGIDGGGTRTRAVVLDEAGRELARRTGPAGLVRPEDPSAAAEAVAGLVRAVLEDAANARPGAGRDAYRTVAGAPVAASLCCGLAGAGRPREREAVRVGLLLAHVAELVMVVGDAEAALEDAFGDAPGVLVIAGTGSIAWARGDDGAMVRVGGWGQLIDDAGSGWDMGLQALRAVARAADGRSRATALTQAVLSATGCTETADLIRFAAGAAKADIGALAATVTRCAEAGDLAAAEIRAATVAAIVELAVTAAARARLQAAGIALAGGLIEPGGPLREDVRAALGEALPGAAVRTEPVDAARGAALLGLRTVKA
jgi:glucosamine kinase